MYTMLRMCPDYGYYPTEIMRFMMSDNDKKLNATFKKLLAKDLDRFNKTGKKIQAMPKYFPKFD